MSPSTAPDSTVSQGSASSAPAGMVSGNDGAVNAGTTPVYHMGDSLQGSGDPWAGTALWLSFNTGVGGRSDGSFSRMRSKGSRFTLGVWGLRVCSLDVAFASATVRNRSQPSATVRNRSQPFARSPYGRAYGKFCRRGPFWRFQTCRCFVSRGRRGTSWHSDVFWNVSKVVFRGRRNTFATFSEDVLQFSWQAQHFGRVHRHFSWQAQHFRRVMLRVFCKSHWQGCVKWRQGANSVAGVAFCAMR